MRISGWKTIVVFAFSLLCAFMHQIPAAAQGWPNGYGYRRTITIDHTKVPNTDQANFPVLFSGTYSDLATTSNGGVVTSASGYDIIFTSDVGGANVLPFERESYNAATGSVLYWVQVPTLSHTSDTVVYMFYGNSSITTDQSNQNGTWDSNYKGVWHLPNGTTLTASDSTSNGNNGTNGGSTATTGEIDGAANFSSSSSQYISVADSSRLKPTNLTFSFWMKPSGTQTRYAHTIHKGSGSAAPYGSFFFQLNESGSDSTEGGLYVGTTNDAANGINYPSGSFASGTWYYMVGTFNSSTKVLSGYKNGALTGTATAAVSTILYDTTGLSFGRQNTSGPYFNGVIDEIRISSSVRSADWISTEYNDQSSPSTFYSVGTASSSGLPIISSLSTNAGNIGVTVTITGTGFGSTQGSSSTVTFNGTAATSITSWSATSIEATVPAGATTGNVVVTTATGPSNGVLFTVTGGSWSNGYTYRRAITIFHTNVPNTDRSNFPFLFSGTYPYLASTGNGGFVTNASGYDIVFAADASGTTMLPFEQESYSATGNVKYWVQIPALSHTHDTVIYAFFGNSSVTTDQSNKTGVWDSNYQGVWHLPNGSTLSVGDSTSNGNNGTVQGGVTAASGQIDGAASFDGSTGYISTTSDLGWVFSLTSEAWVNTTSTAGHKVSGWESNQTGTSSAGYDGSLYVNASGKAVAGCYNGSSTTIESSTTVNDGNWHHLALTLDTSAAFLSLYVDGVSQGTVTCYDAGGYSVYFRIGSYKLEGWPGGSDGYFSGKIDEARFSNTVRSADWIATEYNNQSSPVAFYDEGSPAILNLSSASGHYGDSITITGRNFGTSQGSSTVTFAGTPASVTSWSATSIVATVPAGANSGNVLVTVSGVVSNGVNFNLLPTSWLDSDIGTVGLAGGSTYENGTYTVKGAGTGLTSGTADSFHFTYQSLSGDGTIVARIVSTQSTSYAGVMIRETLTTGSTYFSVGYYPAHGSMGWAYRTSTGGSGYTQYLTSLNLPYWVKVVRSGNTFTGYESLNAVDWTQVGTTQTISMATNVYVGVDATSGSTSSLATVTFDNVSIGTTATPVPLISNISDTTGSVGSEVVLTGSNFGATQSGSLVLLNDAPVTVNSWSNASITITIPTGATSGYMVVSVAPSMNDSNPVYFTITAYPLPVSWIDQDIGTVGLAGSATYANGIYTVNGAGDGFSGTADSLHFVDQPLSGDGTIVARMVSADVPLSTSLIGVMIRETLTSGSTYFSVGQWGNGDVAWGYRASTGGSSAQSTGSGMGLPYWVKVVRSGNTFTGYMSVNSVDWVQVGTTETITMATNVYAGVYVTSGATNSMATATFDNVSIATTSYPAPVISSSSATTGSVGNEVVLIGSNFGATQSGSLVLLNDAAVTVNSWSNTSITITISTGATSGYMVVSVAPSMNDSNPVYFTITAYPLPVSWIDQDIGTVGLAGSATYANGTYTVKGAGSGPSGTTVDSFHFADQPLSGDGTIVARIVGTQGLLSTSSLGVMIRETLTSGSTYFSVGYWGNGNYGWGYRTTTGGSGDATVGSGISLPYWVKVVRSGNTFTGYISVDAVDWTQVGSAQTISMATNVYAGLYVGSGSVSTLATAMFDDVSISTASNPAPVISSTSATTGAIGSEVTITGSNFGASQNGSIVRLSGVPMAINSWSDTSVTCTISSGAATGLLMVSVAPSMNDSNPVVFTVTDSALPSGWLDTDIGSVGTAGSAGYSGATFTVNAAGNGFSGTADSFHLAYESLSGDGTIVARIVSLQNTSYAGVMIRETLTAGSRYFSAGYYPPYESMGWAYRTSTSGSGVTQILTSLGLPYWVMVSRSGNSFNAYASPDGVYWTQLGTTQTITMATGVYIGLGATSGNTSSLATATFDNVAVTAGTPPPTPNISSISPTSGGISASVTINGTNFGATQGSSSVYFNGAAATTITSWGATQIVAAVPSTATTGPVTVVANGLGSNKTVAFTFYNPVISSLAPPAAPIGGSVILTGSGFGASQGSSTVQFNSVNASITSWSDASITVTVPSSATSGSVTVTRGGVVSNTEAFSVIEGTTITGISPSNAEIGASVTITGTGFGPTQSDSAVAFYGALATSVTSWSDTSITAVVPAGASTGQISVMVAGKAVYGPNFTLAFTATITDSLGNNSTYVSEFVGGQWEFTSSDGSGCSTCTVRGVIENTYDASGNTLTTTDALGNVTTNTYDSLNDLLTQTVQVDSTHTATTTYTYNTFGEVLTVTDPLGNVTTNAYDTHGNLTSVTSPAPGGGPAASVTQFTYNSLGELTQITDPLGHATTMTYTTAGLIATITDAQSNVTTYTYDAQGNRTSVTDALSHETTFAYDAKDRLTTITYPDTTTTAFTYDIRGRRTSVTDQNGKTTSYAYDDADRLTSVTDAASNVTGYAYDTEDNLTEITDANTHSTFFTYDAFGRVTNTNFPSSLSETYAYDADNNLTSKTDRKGQTITYLYDALNRLTSKTYPDTTSVDYVYDLVGKVTQVNDPTGTYAFAYDNMGRLIGTTTSYSFLTGRNFTNSYSYDAASNRTGYTDPEGGSTTYAYDTLNRLTSLAPPSAFGSGSFGFSYDALSRRTQMTRPNSVTTNYTYDSLSRLLTVLHQLSGSTIDGASYALDNAGNRTAKTDQLASVTSNYTYDSLYQLTQVTQAATTTESYSYDAVGNRLTSLGVSSYTVNNSNELTATPTASYTYDNNGNTLTKTVGSNTTTYAWDYENRLTSVTLPASGGTVTFKYDPLGRRIEKVSPTFTSIFSYDGVALDETANATGGVVARYADGQDLDEPLAELRSGATSYYEADGLGSVTSLTASNGSIVESYANDSFGKQIGSTGSLQNAFDYTAREFDAETNLYYYRARYYDPIVGRFISSDPTGFSSSVNFYSYGNNNPLGLRDPLGLSPDPCGCSSTPTSSIPRTFGLVVTGTAAAGGGSLGGSVATASAGVASSNSSTQLVVTGGAAMSAGNFVKGIPSSQSSGGAVESRSYGAAAGGGLAITLSNGQPCQLRGPFKTMNFDIGFGLNVSGSFAFGQDGTYQFTIGIPGLSWGVGAEVSSVTTNTGVTGARH